MEEVMRNEVTLPGAANTQSRGGWIHPWQKTPSALLFSKFRMVFLTHPIPGTCLTVRWIEEKE